MAQMARQHREMMAYCLAVAWTTSCSIYSPDLLSEARGEGSKANAVGSGGSGSGGEEGGDGDGDLGSGGGGSGGDPSNGGDSSSGGDPSGGDGGEPATGGEGGSGCSMGDCCPDDPDKDDPGECGCDEPDDDTDGDLTPDCNDMCPDEPTKTEPGDCGCGVPGPEEARCSALKNGIVHRYSFDGADTEVIDRVGEQHGTIENGGVQDGGVLTLDGIDQYVSLPAGMVSSLTNASFEAWFTWNGGGEYQRIFDFGEATGEPKEGLSYLYVAVSKIGEGPGSGFSLMGNSVEVETEATDVISTGTQHHIALVANEDDGAFSLYIDGTFQSGIAFSSSLSNINDVSCYLGWSLFEADPAFNGTLDEFRIYDVALTTSQIAYSHAQGPDAVLFE